MAKGQRPLLNPVLSLRIDPTPVNPSGGGKSRNQIVTSRLPQQRKLLKKQFLKLKKESTKRRTYNSLIPVAVRMFDDAFAPTKTPNDFFTRNADADIISPIRHGYLIEVSREKLDALSDAASNDDAVVSQVDISNIESVELFDISGASKQSIELTWKQAQATVCGRLFRIKFLPYRDGKARSDLMRHLNEQLEDDLFQPIDTRHPEARPAQNNELSSLADGMRSYRNTPNGQATILVQNVKRLRKLVSSGVVFQYEAVSPIHTASPGTGAEPHPEPDAPSSLQEPVVGIIDGGLSATRYKNQVAWTADPYVSNVDADKLHGNQIASLVIHGYAWNNNLKLPQLDCQIGVAQAIAKEGCPTFYSPDSFLRYLKLLFKKHPDVRVWNMSFNEAVMCEEDEFSHLGHEISLIAREYDVLPIISIGNIGSHDLGRMYPPADCEAALTVGGRLHDSSGNPDGPCPVSASGLAPQGTLKPEMSSFSRVRVIGGSTVQGSSFSTANLSVIGAHTFDQLKEPTPDLVKALILNKGELDDFCLKRGFGTPSYETLPWTCSDDVVTLAWTDELRAGKAYYWEDLPITDNLIKNGGLFGHGVLTAILNPNGLLAPGGGANYFSCRLEVSLQYTNKQGKPQTLLGPMNLSQIPEASARSKHHKWNPVRHHSRDFTNTPLTYSGDSFRLYARVFARDLYLYNYLSNEEVPPLPVAFVLTLKSASADSALPLYSEMTQALGNYVESAIVDQDVEIEL